HAWGGVAAAQGRALAAAQLWGAADALRERLGAALTPDEKAIEELFASIVEAELGPGGPGRRHFEGGPERRRVHRHHHGNAALASPRSSRVSRGSCPGLDALRALS